MIFKLINYFLKQNLNFAFINNSNLTLEIRFFILDSNLEINFSIYFSNLNSNFSSVNFRFKFLNLF